MYAIENEVFLGEITHVPEKELHHRLITFHSYIMRKMNRINLTLPRLYFHYIITSNVEI